LITGLERIGENIIRELQSDEWNAEKPEVEPELNYDRDSNLDNQSDAGLSDDLLDYESVQEPLSWDVAKETIPAYVKSISFTVDEEAMTAQDFEDLRDRFPGVNIQQFKHAEFKEAQTEIVTHTKGNQTEYVVQSRCTQTVPVEKSEFATHSQGTQTEPVKKSESASQPQCTQIMPITILGFAPSPRRIQNETATSNNEVKTGAITASEKKVQMKAITTSEKKVQRRAISTSEKEVQTKAITTREKGVQTKAIVTKEKEAQTKAITTKDKEVQTMAILPRVKEVQRAATSTRENEVQREAITQPREMQVQRGGADSQAEEFARVKFALSKADKIAGHMLGQCPFFPVLRKPATDEAIAKAVKDSNGTERAISRIELYCKWAQEQYRRMFSTEGPIIEEEAATSLPEPMLRSDSTLDPTSLRRGSLPYPYSPKLSYSISEDTHIESTTMRKLAGRDMQLGDATPRTTSPGVAASSLHENQRREISEDTLVDTITEKHNIEFSNREYLREAYREWGQNKTVKRFAPRKYKLDHFYLNLVDLYIIGHYNNDASLRNAVLLAWQNTNFKWDGDVPTLEAVVKSFHYLPYESSLCKWNILFFSYLWTTKQAVSYERLRKSLSKYSPEGIGAFLFGIALTRCPHTKGDEVPVLQAWCTFHDHKSQEDNRACEQVRDDILKAKNTSLVQKTRDLNAHNLANAEAFIRKHGGRVTYVTHQPSNKRKATPDTPTPRKRGRHRKSG
jgi:hypothetical protein